MERVFAYIYILITVHAMMHSCACMHASVQVSVCICSRAGERGVCGSTGMYLCERERGISLCKYWYAFFIRVGERDFFVQVPVCICVVAGEGVISFFR